ncbi:unnamed protein product (macronuclear) [Paramecium tetraurelia]|uniref:FCP1 homology domain-containing protein n=1 Tax=Paramecium tetraurelia TaxID=5888 RepID=A0DAV8_PARTE|nr:uncharacterized protein GSPATT00015082001 [Paramecium tetraurelia]CAK80175.1 unnamed protein product [Paramecium tetraurelia]|eukprot:XP_001447572.1 hypothetical protein (macronuclear) [Paramecium tetraurelia strain d4-2]
MNSYRQNEQKKLRNSYLTNNLETSMISNKSKNSFKDLIEYRSILHLFINLSDHTPQERKGHRNQQSASKIKQILSNLVQTDQISPKSSFGQSLREKQDMRLTDNTCKQFLIYQDSKTPKANDSYYKQQLVAPQSTREVNQNSENLQNLYYMFQNKQSDSQIKQNVLTLSQLAKQHQQQRNNNNQITQKNWFNNNQNKDSYHSSIYISQIQQLKQKIDNSLQKKTSQKTEKYQNQNETSTVKNNGISTISKRPQQDLNCFAKTEEISDQLIQLVLQKELQWNQLNQNLEKLNYSSLVNHCMELHQCISQLSERKNSEYLYDIDINIIDTFLLESFTVLIMLMEQSRGQQILDQNLKNLIVYITQSNFYLIQTVNSAVVHSLLKQRIELRQFQQKKQQSKAKQTLQKNNFIIRSILELMQVLTTRLIQRYISHLISNNKVQNLILFSKTKYQIKFLSSYKKITVQRVKVVIKVQVLQTKRNRPYFLLNKQKIIHQFQILMKLWFIIKKYTQINDDKQFPNGGGQFLVRPYTEEFLEKLSKYYEIVIFTAAQPDYANFIIDIIDKQQIVKARLYREHTFQKDNVYIKDLSILGRNLNRVIIVDNMPENFQLQPENGIYIQSWTGEQKDRALKDLMPLLECNK